MCWYYFYFYQFCIDNWIDVRGLFLGGIKLWNVAARSWKWMHISVLAGRGMLLLCLVSSATARLFTAAIII